MLTHYFSEYSMYVHCPNDGAGLTLKVTGLATSLHKDVAISK